MTDIAHVVFQVVGGAFAIFGVAAICGYGFALGGNLAPGRQTVTINNFTPTPFTEAKPERD